MEGRTAWEDRRYGESSPTTRLLRFLDSLLCPYIVMNASLCDCCRDIIVRSRMRGGKMGGIFDIRVVASELGVIELILDLLLA